MITPFIDLKTQYQALKPEIASRIEAVLEHGQYIMGPEIVELEERLREHTGAAHCVTVSSGTDALLISLMALDIRPGDEVITTPFTFVATAEVIALLGAIPVFVDVDALTCNIDVTLLEAKISNKTKAIMPVGLYGQPADMDEINAVADRHDLPVIEDAAQSFGASYKQRKSCNLSTFGCTSFFPSKPLGCYGDGGALFTNDDRLAQICRELRVHGQQKRYVHSRIGVGGRLDTLQAGILLAKLERFDFEVEQRMIVASRYDALFDAAGIERVAVHADRSSVYAQYTIMVNERDAVAAALKARGIPTAVHYPVPLNAQEAYRHYCCEGCTPVADELAKRVMSLPMHPDLTAEQQQLIASAACEVIAELT